MISVLRVAAMFRYLYHFFISIYSMMNFTLRNQNMRCGKSQTYHEHPKNVYEEYGNIELETKQGKTKFTSWKSCI